MIIHKLKLLITSFAFFAIAFNVFALEDAKEYKLRVLFVNDQHGHFWKNRKSEGGFAAISTLVKNLRKDAIKKGYRVLLLSAGDFNTGVPESDTQEAAPDIAAMNYLKFDALSIGNHEFDNTIDLLNAQIKQANFPMISANIVNISDNKPVYTPYLNYSLGGLKVAILGLTTESTPILTNPDNYKTIKFLPAVEVAKQLAPSLKEKSDFLIALTHLGFYQNGEHGSQAPGDYTLAKNVPEIDLIVGGHSHDVLDPYEKIGNSIVVQAGSNSKYLGQIDLTISKAGGTAVDFYKIYPINLKKTVQVDGEKKSVFIETEIIEDPKLVAILDPYQQKGAATLNVKIGETEGLFVGQREEVRSKETNLGNLISYVMAKYTKADLAIMNSGGIRSNLPVGDVSYRDVLTVQPFGNTICTVDLNFDELVAYLKAAAEKTGGGYPQFYGVSFTYEDSQVTDVKVQGEDLDKSKTYTLATNNFVAAGGDGYPAVKNKPSFLDSGLNDASLLVKYFDEEKVVKASNFTPDGRFNKK